MKRIVSIACCLIFIFSLAACGNKETNQQMNSSQMLSESVRPESSKQPERDYEDAESENITRTMMQSESSSETIVTNMKVQIQEAAFTATLESNSAVIELVQMLEEAPVVIEMSDYFGFEKVGNLGIRLSASNSQTTTQAGDIVLFNGNQIVIFYGSNSWSYTRLGKIDDLSGWEESLGSGNVTVTFSVE